MAERLNAAVLKRVDCDPGSSPRVLRTLVREGFLTAETADISPCNVWCRTVCWKKCWERGVLLGSGIVANHNPSTAVKNHASE